MVRRCIIRNLSKSAQPFDEDRYAFNEVDIDFIETELKLKSRASELGKKNLPTVQDEEKDEIAKKIDFYFSEIINTTKNQLSNILNAGHNITSNQLSSGKVDSIEAENEANECQAELRKVVHTEGQKIHHHKRNLLWMKKEVSDFREKNQIIGPASYPDDKKKSLIYALVFLVFGLELFLNAWVLGDAYPGGVAGVMVEVLIFSLINMALAWWLGNFILRMKNHINWIKKLTGWFLLIVLILSIIFLNLFYAHYRDALASVVLSDYDLSRFQVLGEQAVNTLWANPFRLIDFKSYLLWGLGMVLAMFAMYEFYCTDAPYPEYGKLERDEKEFSDRYTESCDDFYAKTNDIVARYNREVEQRKLLGSANKQAAKKRIERFNSVTEKYKDWIRHLEFAGDALYSMYRTENILARDDGIKHLPCFQVKFRLDDAVKRFEPHLEESDYDEESDLTDFYEKKSKEFKELLNRYHSLVKDIEDMGPEDFDMRELNESVSAEQRVSSWLSKNNL